MDKLLTICLGLILALNIETVHALKLEGHFTQGGLVLGQLEGASNVRFNGQVLDLTANGEFVFGFSRDDKLKHILSWLDANGKKQSKTLEIVAREYKIDRINGVAKKYVSPAQETLARIKREAREVKQARAIKSKRTDFLKPFIRPAKGRISGVYGSQRFFNGEPRRPHFGLDIANKTGTPVIAPASGKVVYADPDLYYSGGTLIIDHGYGVSTTYIHLHKIVVQVGQEVKVGEKVAEIGATGRVTGPHLDWRLNWGNVRLDPALYMSEDL